MSLQVVGCLIERDLQDPTLQEEDSTILWSLV